MESSPEVDDYPHSQPYRWTLDEHFIVNVQCSTVLVPKSEVDHASCSRLGGSANDTCGILQLHEFIELT